MVLRSRLERSGMTLAMRPELFRIFVSPHELVGDVERGPYPGDGTSMNNDVDFFCFDNRPNHVLELLQDGPEKCLPTLEQGCLHLLFNFLEFIGSLHGFLAKSS